MSKKVTESIEPQIEFLRIIDSYLEDLESLSDMHSNVTPFLKKIEEEKIDEFRALLTSKSPPIPESESESETETLTNLSGEKLETPKKKTRSFSIQVKGHHADLLMSDIRKLSSAEKLFKKQAIVTLVSRFDEFFGKLLHLVLEQNPTWLSSSEKTLTYKELIEIKSVEKAIEAVISKEVENLMFGSHAEQIAYIDEKLKLGISENFSSLPHFLEVAERRNLFVHTGGVISTKYLEKCNSFGYSTQGLKKGDCLNGDLDYFNQAFIIYFEAGLRIGQAAYRRLFPTKLETADSGLNHLSVKFMRAGDYKLAELISSFDIGIPDKLRSKNTEFPYFARINKAASLKFQNKEFESCLESVPWSAFHPKYALCLHILREEFDQAIDLMKTPEIQTSVGDSGFRGWPIFRDFRETNEFLSVYEEVFNKKFEPELDDTDIIIKPN